MPLVQAMRRVLLGLAGFGVCWVFAGLSAANPRALRQWSVPLGLGSLLALGYLFFQLVGVVVATRRRRRDGRTDYDEAYDAYGPRPERTEVVLLPSHQKRELRVLAFLPPTLFFLAFIAMEPPQGLLFGGGGAFVFAFSAVVATHLWKRRAAALRLTPAGLEQRTLFDAQTRAWSAFTRFAPARGGVRVELAGGGSGRIASDYAISARALAGLLEHWRQVHAGPPEPYR